MGGWLAGLLMFVMIAGFLPDVLQWGVWQGMVGGAQGWGLEGLGCVVGGIPTLGGLVIFCYIQGVS